MSAVVEFFQQDAIQIAVVFGVLVFAVLAFFREWLPPDLVAMFSMGIVLITGVSTGIGRAAAFALLDAGYEVYGSDEKGFTVMDKPRQLSLQAL